MAIIEDTATLRVYLQDNDGDYIMIPRLLDRNIILADQTSESATTEPDSR